MAELVTQFHNLEGISIGERKKSLHKLLKDPSLKTQQDEVVKQLQPQTFLEELFKLDILIFLRRTTDLLEILKEGNEIFVSKIVKQHWFFKDAFQSISEEDFVNNFLPGMSYALRMKVLKRLSIVLSEDKVDNLFDALLKRYGLFIAKQFLAFCTTAKIIQVLKAHEIELHGGHLQLFMKKDKTLLLVYIDELKKQGKELSDKKFIKYVAKKDVAFFLELKDKYEIKTMVGRRTTKKIIDMKKDDILANPKDYVDILKESVVSRKLKKDFKEFYYQLFPKDDKEVLGHMHHCNKFLEHAPPALQYSIMADTYQRVYNEDLTQNENLMSDQKTLTRLSARNPQACAMIAVTRYEKTNDNKYLKYMPITKSVPILKEKINLTSNIYDRARLIEILIEVCQHHKDLKALEEVMLYFCKRHRNDDSYTRKEFTRSVLWKFKCDDFNDVHWNCLVDLQKVQRMREEFISDSYLLFKYMEYLFKNNKPIKEHLDTFVTDMIEGYMHVGDGEYNPDMYKTVLLELQKQIPVHFSKQNYTQVDIRLIGLILDFNKKFPEKAIDIYSIPRFVQVLTMTKFEYRSWEHTNNVRMIVTKKERKEVENEILDAYFSSSIDLLDLDIIKWFIKHDITVIAKYFDKILAVLVRDRFNFWYLLKKYSHLDLDKKSVAYLKQEFNSEQKFNNKIKLVDPLVRLISPQEFLSFTEQFLPKADKIDLCDTEATEIYKLQCEIAKTLKRIVHKPSALETVLNYCRGDYLASALGSLYSVISRIPEDQIPATLGYLSKKAVSVRKHALFLSCNILEQKLVIELLKKAGAEEKNVSIQKHLYSTAIKYFTKNPSEESWNLVKVFINFIDKSDVESLKKLSEFTISKRYRHMFWQAAWEFLEKNKANISKHDVYMSGLLKQMDKELLQQLPIELLENIVKQYFLGKSELSKKNSLIRFTVLFLCSEKRMDTFKLVFEMVAQYKSENPDWFKLDASSDKLRKFFEEFTSQRKEDYVTAEIIDKFTSNWNTNFTPVETFKEHVFLNVLKMHKDSNTDLKIFAENVSKFVDDNLQTYGPYIFSKLSEFVRYSVGLLLKPEIKATFIQNILNFNKDTVHCVLCLQFLTLLVTKDKDIKEVILAQIKENQDPSVQILYNLHIRNM